MASNIDLQAVHDLLIEIAENAGRMITTATPTTEAANEKKNGRSCRRGAVNVANDI